MPTVNPGQTSTLSPTQAAVPGAAASSTDSASAVTAPEAPVSGPQLQLGVGESTPDEAARPSKTPLLRKRTDDDGEDATFAVELASEPGSNKVRRMLKLVLDMASEPATRYCAC